MRKQAAEQSGRGMKRLLWIVALVVAVGVGYSVHDFVVPGMSGAPSDRGAESMHVPPVTRAQDWVNIDVLRQRLRDMIDANLHGISPQQVKEFLQDPRNRLILQQAALTVMAEKMSGQRSAVLQKRRDDLQRIQAENEQLHAAFPDTATMPPKELGSLRQNEARIRAIREDLESKHSFADLVTDPDTAELVTRIVNSLTLTRRMLFTGDYSDPAETIAILTCILREVPDIKPGQTDYDTALATALEYSRSGWTQKDAAARAAYFIQSHRAGLLDSVYEKISFWQRRALVGYKGLGLADNAGTNDLAPSVPSLTFSRDQVHLPPSMYTGACWQAPYRLYNIFGDIVHDFAYFIPFKDTLYTRFNEATREVGGVCGGLSHYGASSAQANGVPAFTSGEPEHCSYVVLVKNKWTPAYSLSWDRGLHWQVFRGNERYSSLHLAGKMFGKSPSAKTGSKAEKLQKSMDLSRAMLALANLYAGEDVAKAEALYRGAYAVEPLNYFAWRDYAEYLANPVRAAEATAWLQLCHDLGTSLAPRYPEIAAELLIQSIYPYLAKVSVDEEQLRQSLIEFWKDVTVMGPVPEWDKEFSGRWNVERMLREQMKLLGIDPQKDGRCVGFLEEVLTALADKPTYFAIVLSFGSQLCDGMPQELKGKMIATMTHALSIGNGIQENRESLLGPIILATESAGDIQSFQAIAKVLPEQFRSPSNSIPEPEPFPGKVVSRGGILRLSTSDPQYDHPCAHWGVLEPGVGGSFHTDHEKDAWVVVTLPKQAHLTGLVIRTTDGNLHRLNNMQVQVSEDGERWRTVADLGECTQRDIRVDLGGEQPLAKYVRILRVGGPEFFHLLNIVAYGKPAA